MGDSAIEWTDKTWNPVRGCERVSPGCKNCYAERVAMRFSGKGKPYEGLVKIANGHPQWTGKVRFVEEHLRDPLKWREPKKVFVNSMSDLFHDDVTVDQLCLMFSVMCQSKKHSFQVLTKRPKRMREFISRWDSMTRDFGPLYPHVWPQNHIWLGVSVENPDYKWRIDELRETPAAVRFLSLEPLLGDLGKINLGGIHWVIVGGESGPDARPMHPAWARSIRDQCVAAGVPFFFKQHGEWMPVFHGINPSDNDPKCRIHDGFTFPAQPGDLEQDGRLIGQHMWKVGKKAAGRFLDGREWNEYPKVNP